ncbi:hypothetical protein CcaCcLH18_09092 [Colletotrichum camelliae]|nr:hypothetical protein CcaCcLH18_09092 [Colletotrichum camelliae]
MTVGEMNLLAYLLHFPVLFELYSLLCTYHDHPQDDIKGVKMRRLFRFIIEDFVEICLEIACCHYSVVYRLLPICWDVPDPEDAEKTVLKKRNKLGKIRKKEDEALRRKFRKEKRRFALLELPVELRKRIYELVLVRPGFYRLISTKFADRSERDSRSILLTCKGVYEEAHGIFFSENRFALASGDWRYIPYRFQVQDFVRTIGPINASLVRHFCQITQMTEFNIIIACQRVISLEPPEETRY